MDIIRNGSNPATGSPDYFTGSVRGSALRGPDSSALAARWSHSSRARMAWHTHPPGQTLIIASGYGRVQRWGGPVEEVHPGDVVWFAPGEKHWHGAAPATAMTHMAVQEELDGEVVTWMEHVSDEQYLATV